MEDQVRELLRDLAGDIPAPQEVPSTLRPRARRRIAVTVGVTVVVVGALALGGMAAVRSIIEASPVPANPRPTVEPSPLGAGEVLTVVNGNLVAQDPDGGEIRTIVDAKTLDKRDSAFPKRAEDITGAAWSPDRKWVAFRAGGLWVADTIGGAPRQLTPDQGWDPWAWSPTHDQLAVVRGRDLTLIDPATGRYAIFENVAGARDAEGYAVHALAWSPDGTRIAYDAGPGWGSVYSIDAETGEHSLLVRRPAGMGGIKDIEWSPDGAHVAIWYFYASYSATHGGELAPLAGTATALWVANADGSDPRFVDYFVASQWPVWNPGMSVGTAWSPDGTRLANTSFSGDPQEIQVWTVAVDGSMPSLVARYCCVSDGGDPVWSPDGSQIAFETEIGGGTPGVSLDHLVVNADGSADPVAIDDLVNRSWAGGWYFCFCYG